MFRSKTVIVVGAGASCELGFPSGATLLEQVSSALDIRFSDGFHMNHGDSRIYDAYRTLCRLEDGRVGPVDALQIAGWRIRDAARLGLSIDNVIHQFSDEPLVAQAGKIAIARLILKAEKDSVLRVPKDRIDELYRHSEIRNSWLGGFAQLLVQDKTKNQLSDLFDNVIIISFNYDRSIRRFLPFALSSQFGMELNEAREMSKALTIFHPYGSLGPLPWEGPGGVEYGDADRASLVDVATRLRTFTEQIEDSEELDSMRREVNSAERVVFLGFGYHRQNMELLTKGVEGSASHVYGTALGLSDADKEVVEHQLQAFLLPHYRAHRKIPLSPVGCVQFISEYFRALTA